MRTCCDSSQPVQRQFVLKILSSSLTVNHVHYFWEHFSKHRLSSGYFCEQAYLMAKFIRQRCSFFSVESSRQRSEGILARYALDGRSDYRGKVEWSDIGIWCRNRALSDDVVSCCFILKILRYNIIRKHPVPNHTSTLKSLCSQDYSTYPKASLHYYE